MNLTDHDKERILESFPSFKLSYENKNHKKISSDFFLTIPKGRKYFAWFRHFKQYNVCVFLQLAGKFSIKDIFIYSCCFNPLLCTGAGTILYGTIFNNKKITFFNIENIYYFKNKKCDNMNQRHKLELLSILFESYIHQTIMTTEDILFGLPFMDTNYTRFKKTVQTLPYDIYCIQHRFLDKFAPFFNEFITKIDYKIFTVKAHVHPDIYELYNKKGEVLDYFDIAYIPDYKTSVFMNSLFRNIKENDNLDTLEESDDEEEFQNTNIDKYVYLDKQLCMRCVYMPKFKKWKPMEVIS